MFVFAGALASGVFSSNSGNEIPVGAIALQVQVSPQYWVPEKLGD